MINYIIQAEKWLKEMKKREQCKVCVGFDGFVDTIVRPVYEIKTDGQREFFSTINKFGTYIKGKAEKSCSIELVQEVKKAGGNAFIFSDVLAGLQLDTICIGAFGYPKQNDLFSKVKEHLEILSISEPGNCIALEFEDGKVMLADNTGINELSYKLLLDRIGKDKLISLFEDSDVLAFMNWSEIQGSGEIWKGIHTEILPELKLKQKKLLFLDISDCSGRNKKDILEMLNQIRAFSEYVDVILSLNSNEFHLIDSLLSEHAEAAEEKNGMRRLYELCSLKYLFLHFRDCSYGLDSDNTYFIKNRFVQNPKLSTGGGDNFNAGLLYALMNGVGIEPAMVIGNAASGYYISRGKSADQEGLLEYLHEWKQEIAK